MQSRSQPAHLPPATNREEQSSAHSTLQQLPALPPTLPAHSTPCPVPKRSARPEGCLSVAATAKRQRLSSMACWYLMPTIRPPLTHLRAAGSCPSCSREQALAPEDTLPNWVRRCRRFLHSTQKTRQK